jgi:peptidoglycan hydrolase-like protein with peptidoglycan-binding domain
MQGEVAVFPAMPRRLSVVFALLVTATLLVAAPRPAAAEGTGDGVVLGFGSAPFLGAPAADSLRSPLVGMAGSPSGAGYWLVASDGGVFAYGDASFHGSTGAIKLNQPIVGMASTPSGGGYWLVASDGGLFAFGDAPFLGSMGGTRLNQPVVGMAATPSGKGYWLVARDGGLFSFGDATFLGSMGGTKLNQPVVGLASTPTAAGYWLVAADGGLFAFGDAPFLGSSAGTGGRPVSAMATTATGKGYWLAADDGTVKAFGDAAALGSGTGNLVPGTLVVGLARSGDGGYWLAAGRPVLRSGAIGPLVEDLQRRLLDLGFWGIVDGRFGTLTTQQIYAFQKANDLPRDGQLDAAEMRLLENASPVVPKTSSGRVIEVDKTRQIIVVAVNGRTEWVFNTSTGNGRPYGSGQVAVTPEGRFRISRQIDGLRISELGELFRPKYFVGGYAIHGSPSVPPFPASHGCVRLTNAAINFVWANDVMPIGTEVWVYR